MEENTVEKIIRDSAELAEVYDKYHDNWQDDSEETKEAKKENKQGRRVVTLIQFFNKGWETTVRLVVKLTGLSEGAVRNALLVAIIPLITLLGRLGSFVYLFVYYNLRFKIPVAYLIVNDSLLISFALGLGGLALAVLLIMLVLWLLRAASRSKFVKGMVSRVSSVVWIFLLAFFAYMILSEINPTLLEKKNLPVWDYDAYNNFIMTSAGSINNTSFGKPLSLSLLITWIFLIIFIYIGIALIEWLRKEVGQFLSTSLERKTVPLRRIIVEEIITVTNVLCFVLFAIVSKYDVAQSMDSLESILALLWLFTLIIGFTREESSNLFLIFLVGFGLFWSISFLIALVHDGMFNTQSISMLGMISYYLVWLLYLFFLGITVSDIRMLLKGRKFYTVLRKAAERFKRLRGIFGRTKCFLIKRKKAIYNSFIVCFLVVPVFSIASMSLGTCMLAQPYAVTDDKAYAVIYQTNEFSILEKIGVGEETNALVIYTTHQKITTSDVSYKYQSFDIVIINCDM